MIAHHNFLCTTRVSVHINGQIFRTQTLYGKIHNQTISIMLLSTYASTALRCPCANRFYIFWFTSINLSTRRKRQLKRVFFFFPYGVY